MDKALGNACLALCGFVLLFFGIWLFFSSLSVDFAVLLIFAGIFMMAFFTTYLIAKDIQKKRNRRIFSVSCLAVLAFILANGIRIMSIIESRHPYAHVGGLASLFGLFLTAIGGISFISVIFASILAERTIKKRLNDAIKP